MRSRGGAWWGEAHGRHPKWLSGETLHPPLGCSLPPPMGAHREEGLDVKEVLSSALALCWGATVLG